MDWYKWWSKWWITYNIGSQIRFKTSILRVSLCDHSGTYILVKETITTSNKGTATAPNNRKKKVIFKNYALFTNSISEINDKEIDHAKDIDIVISMNRLI